MDIFCKIIDGEIPSNVPFENEMVKCIMDVNPKTPGHMLIIPKEHIEDVLEMDERTLRVIHEVCQNMIKVMMNAYEGINGVTMAVNYGEPQVVKHYHLHLIPSYGDKIPTMSQEDACKLLKKHI